jgi:hypothetical protein
VVYVTTYIRQIFTWGSISGFTLEKRHLNVTFAMSISCGHIS